MVAKEELQARQTWVLAGVHFPMARVMLAGQMESRNSRKKVPGALRSWTGLGWGQVVFEVWRNRGDREGRMHSSLGGGCRAEGTE